MIPLRICSPSPSFNGLDEMFAIRFNDVDFTLAAADSLAYFAYGEPTYTNEMASGAADWGEFA